MRVVDVGGGGGKQKYPQNTHISCLWGSNSIVGTTLAAAKISHKQRTKTKTETEIPADTIMVIGDGKMSIVGIGSKSDLNRYFFVGWEGKGI